MTESDGVRELLRHAVATLAYRGGKAVRGAPAGFSAFRPQEGTRTPGDILAHIGDLLDWSVSLLGGERVWKETPPAAWDSDVQRFFRGLAELDRVLTSTDFAGCPAEKLFQGPVADALTHVGQIVILRRLAGSPMRSESYFKADIAVGRIGPEQTPPRLEFD